MIYFGEELKSAFRKDRIFYAELALLVLLAPLMLFAHESAHAAIFSYFGVPHTWGADFAGLFIRGDSATILWMHNVMPQAYASMTQAHELNEIIGYPLMAGFPIAYVAIVGRRWLK